MNFCGNELRVNEILNTLGLEDISQLFTQIPPAFRNPHIDMPSGLDEMSLRRHVDALAKKNSLPTINFSGKGFYQHYIPAVVDYVCSLGSFSTAYTPYQAEVSQGTLQMLFEYQSYLAEITGMDVVNASHYEGATAFAEALRVLHTARKRGGDTIVILSRLNPEYIEIIQTYLKFSEVKIRFLDIFEDRDFDIPDDCCALSVAMPDLYGRVADISALGKRCKETGVFFHVHCDPLLCSLIDPPGELGADICTGEGQVLGIPVSMGGPYLGIFAVTNEFRRKIPGRIVGETCDQQGRRGFVLALSTREQHIRREKAASNICTNQGLMALRALVYMATMGSDGLQTVAKRCISNAHYLMEKLSEIQGIEVNYPTALHFREFSISCNFPVDALLRAGKDAGIAVGEVLQGNELLISSTEMHSSSDLSAYIALCTEVAETEVVVNEKN